MSMLIDDLVHNKAQIGRAWYIAEPEKGPFLWRIVDAWSVLRGKTQSVIFARAFRKLEDKRAKKDPTYKRRIILTSDEDVKKVIEVANKAQAHKTMGIQFDEFDEVRANGEKLGRNQLCPCGSGKKYKKCHGKK